MNSEPSMKQWRPDQPEAIECLQIVYKVVERCNINCSYCYYFNMGDETPLERPAKVDAEHARCLGAWVARGCEALDIRSVKIAFHGGEPLLLGPTVFDEVCVALRDAISPVANLSFAVQTNGTILNDDWIKTLDRHDVRVGISIDGTRFAHDRFRLGFRGESTFEATEANLIRLLELANGDPSKKPSTISVVDHRVDYGETYRYLRGLGVEAMTFLLPDRSADDLMFRTSREPSMIGDRMVELLDAWLTEDEPNVSVRFINNALGHLQVGRRPGRQRRDRKAVQVIVARSDGTVSIDDSYTPALEWYKDTPAYDIATHELQQFLADPIFQRIESIDSTPPQACTSCSWLSMCGGGDLENRFSRRTGFDNPSVYCESLKKFYAAMCRRMVDAGYPATEIEERFGHVLVA